MMFGSCALTKTFNGSLASHKRDELATVAGALLLQTMVEQTARIKEHFAGNPVLAQGSRDFLRRNEQKTCMK